MRQLLSWPPAIAAFVALVLIAAVPIAGWVADDGQVAKAVFRVQGMSCSGCEATMAIALKKLAGVESVKASYAEGRAEISYRPSQVGVQKIQQAIERLGYKAEREELRAERTPVSDRPAAGRSVSGRPALRDLESLGDLASLLQQTRGQPRIVLLLSPT
jgi:copper chaperone CopZ